PESDRRRPVRSSPGPGRTEYAPNLDGGPWCIDALAPDAFRPVHRPGQKTLALADSPSGAREGAPTRREHKQAWGAPDQDFFGGQSGRVGKLPLLDPVGPSSDEANPEQAEARAG